MPHTHKRHPQALGNPPPLSSSPRTEHIVFHGFSPPHTLPSRVSRANGETHTTTANMHVTACLAGQKVDVEVGEDCRSLQALREAIVEELPQLCVEGFDVSVGGRALDDDEGVVSLTESACLDVVANTRGLAVLALREAGRAASGYGLRMAAGEGDVYLVTLYLDAGVPIDCVDYYGRTSLCIACLMGRVELATLLLDRGSTAIDAKGSAGSRPLVPALFAYGMACSSSERTGSQPVSKTPEQREQVRAAQVAHPAASTSAHDPPRPRPCVWPCELVWRPRPTRGRHTRRPGGRVVCTGIDNPGSNVFPASRPVWQWGGTRYNFYLALRLMRRIMMTTHLFTSRAAKGTWSSRPSCWTEEALRLMRRGGNKSTGSLLESSLSESSRRRPP